MNSLLLVSRAVHFASAIVLFGELVFALAVARSWRGGGAITDRDSERRLFLYGTLSLVASVVSGAGWLAAEAAVMSGLPLDHALRVETLEVVFARTAFGRLWLLRFGLAVALGALLLIVARAKDDERKRRFASGALFVAALYLATIAWSGHAAAGKESERYVQLFSDAIHLLAAGAWLGALLPLAALLKRAQPFDAAVSTHRFSTLGIVSVSALIVTGSVNAWYLVGDVPALFGTSYGRLLLAKLALVAVMIALALVNRLRLAPLISARQPAAAHSLRRNAMLEAAAGVAILAIVGALGITVPAAHQSPVWPFDHTLSLQPAEESSSVRSALVALALLAAIGAGAIVSAERRRSAPWIAGVTFVAAAAIASVWLLAVPAYPTTYSTSPVPYDVEAIVRGADLYGEHCSGCHGARGEGDGPLASTLPERPANLAEHESHHHHRPGNLYWWIAHGIARTPMPGFSTRLDSEQIWDLVQFLHVQADANEARAMTERIDSNPAIRAPDFTFEIAGRPQQSLRSGRAEPETLLVFYTLPQSLPRLRALATDLPAFAAARARVIAVPYGDAAQPRTVAGGEAMLALTSANVPRAYAMFSGAEGSAEDHPAHAELLIDRRGYLRARWIGVPDVAAKRTAEILSDIRRLGEEPDRAPIEEKHAH